MKKKKHVQLQNQRLFTKPYDILCPILRTTDNEPLLDRILETEADFPFDDNITCVSAKSPGSHKRAVEILAHYFRREFRYDFLQYSSEEKQDDDRLLAFMWTAGSPPSVSVVGACCFRWREWEGMDSDWAMQWVWLHPYFRRQGLLTRSWPAFGRLFKSFYVEQPLSVAMVEFLKDKPFLLKGSDWHKSRLYGENATCDQRCTLSLDRNHSEGRTGSHLDAGCMVAPGIQVVEAPKGGDEIVKCDVAKVTAPWECEFGDYDSFPLYDDTGEAVDSQGAIEDCSKTSPPYCKFCPNNWRKYPCRPQAETE